MNNYPLESAVGLAKVRSLESASKIEELYDLFGESYLVKSYTDLLADFSNVIRSIQNGYGRVKRVQDENPKGVLEELRDEITSVKLHHYVEMLPFIQQTGELIADYYKVGCAFKNEL